MIKSLRKYWFLVVAVLILSAMATVGANALTSLWSSPATVTITGTKTVSVTPPGSGITLAQLSDANTTTSAYTVTNTGNTVLTLDVPVTTITSVGTITGVFGNSSLGPSASTTLTFTFTPSGTPAAGTYATSVAIETTP